MNLQVNQNRQFFAINDKSENLNAKYKGSFFAAAEGEPDIYFAMMGLDDEIRRSDLIPVGNILYAKASNPRTTTIQSTKVTLASGVSPIVGKTYVMNISLDNFCNAGIENTYIKHGVVVATSTTASTFYFEMAKSIAQNFKREMNPFIKVYLIYDSSGDTLSAEVTYNASSSSFNQTYTGIMLVGQDIDKYIQGIVEHTVPAFTVSGNIVHDSTNNLDIDWINVTDATTSTVVNSVKTVLTNTDEVSDIEYFCMGERADQYRTLGNVPVNPTRYSVPALTPATDNGWCMLDIHYCYIGDNESIQKSEKTLTIAMPSDGSSNTEFESLVSRFNTLTGLSVSSR